jgi:hypothetical protein
MFGGHLSRPLGSPQYSTAWCVRSSRRLDETGTARLEYLIRCYSARQHKLPALDRVMFQKPLEARIQQPLSKFHERICLPAQTSNPRMSHVPKTARGTPGATTKQASYHVCSLVSLPRPSGQPASTQMRNQMTMFIPSPKPPFLTTTTHPTNSYGPYLF